MAKMIERDINELTRIYEYAMDIYEADPEAALVQMKCAAEAYLPEAVYMAGIMCWNAHEYDNAFGYMCKAAALGVKQAERMGTIIMVSIQNMQEELRRKTARCNVK